MTTIEIIDLQMNQLLAWAKESSWDKEQVLNLRWQGFGAVQAASMLDTASEEALTAKWDNEWRPAFTEFLYQ